MNKLTILLLVIFVFLASIFVSLTKHQVFAEGKDNFLAEEILVKFKESATQNDTAEVHKKLGGRIKETISGINVQIVEVKGKNVGEAVSSYAKDKHVEYAEPNYVAFALTDDVFFTNQWALNNTGQITCNNVGDICTAGTLDADIDAPEAWVQTIGDFDIKIAILDSGIDQDHPDLMGKITVNKNFSGSDTYDDRYGHGTHVAGIAAANTNNSQGVAGIGYQSSLMNYKVLGDDGYGAYSWIANGIIEAANDGADVINLSLGSSQRSTTLESAINYAWNKGVVIAAAAGNSNNSSKTYPAYYSNCIAVAATTNNDVKASFSSYGSWVDVAAPGENVYSTFPNHDFFLQTEYGRSNDYDFGNGTSMSTPFVAGIAALIRAKDQSLSNQEIRNRIEQTADKITGTGTYWIWGRVNACNAVGGNCSEAVPTPTPTQEITPTPIPNQCSYCFRSVCDGQCNPKKDGAMCPDCQ